MERRGGEDHIRAAGEGVGRGVGLPALPERADHRGRGGREPGGGVHAQGDQPAGAHGHRLRTVGEAEAGGDRPPRARLLVRVSGE